jgi:hypothetical protein
MSFCARSLFAAAVLLAMPQVSPAAWPFTREGIEPRSPEWYAYHSSTPVGQPQRLHHGKLWPAINRHCDEKAPMVHRYHHNLYWPHPYIEEDKAAVDQFEQIQIMNGWQSATTLYEYHFTPDGHELNSAGRDHLYWIMSSVPIEYRTAYVQASRHDPNVSNLRLVSAQNEAARFVGPDQAPPILLRVAHPHGTPAAEVMSVFDFRRTTLTPPPVLQGGGGAGEAAGG